MSEDLYEPINEEPSVEDSLRSQVAALQSALALSQKTEVGLRERLLNLTVELETVKELYEEGLRERMSYRISQRHALRKLRDDFQAQLNTVTANLQTTLEQSNISLENTKGELSEVLDKFGKLKVRQRDAERASEQHYSDVVWLLALCNSGFQMNEIVGKEVSPADVTSARTRTVVLPSKLTKAKVKQLFS